MLYNAVNGQLNIGISVMDYIKFGKGEKNIIMIPGLGDGLKTVKGLALPMAVMYRQFAKDFTVWMFSRKQPLEADATTRTMARDLKTAMDELGIDCAAADDADLLLFLHFVSVSYRCRHRIYRKAS